MARRTEEFGSRDRGADATDQDRRENNYRGFDHRGIDDRDDGLGKSMFNFDDDNPAMVSVAREKLEDRAADQREYTMTRYEARDFAERKFDETLEDLPRVRDPNLQHILTRLAVMEGDTWERMDTEKLDWNHADNYRLLVAFQEDTNQLNPEGRYQLARELAGEVNQAGHADIDRRLQTLDESTSHRMESQTLARIQRIFLEGRREHLLELESGLAQGLTERDDREIQEAIQALGQAEQDIRTRVPENSVMYGLDNQRLVEKLQDERMEAIQNAFLTQSKEDLEHGTLAHRLEASPSLQKEFARFLREIDHEDAQQVTRHTTRQINRSGGRGWDTEINIRHLMAEAA